MQELFVIARLKIGLDQLLCCEFKISRGDTVLRHAGKSSARKLWCCTECKKGTAEQRHFLSRLHLFLLVSHPLPLFLSSEDGWHASSDASSGSLTYFRKYHRFLLIALLSSRPLRTSPTGPTNPLITSSPRSPFIHAHVTASLHNTKIKTTRIVGNFLAVKGMLWWSNLGSFWWNTSTMPVQFEIFKKRI